MEFERKQKEFESWFATADIMNPETLEELERWIDELDGLDPNFMIQKSSEESLADFKALYGPLFLPEEEQDPRIQAWRKTLPDNLEVFTQEQVSELKIILYQIQEEQN